MIPKSVKAQCSDCDSVPCTKEWYSYEEEEEIGMELSCNVNPEGVEICITIIYTVPVTVWDFDEDCSAQETCYDECQDDMDEDDDNDYSALPGGRVPACLLLLIEVESA